MSSKEGDSGKGSKESSGHGGHEKQVTFLLLKVIAVASRGQTESRQMLVIVPIVVRLVRKVVIVPIVVRLVRKVMIVPIVVRLVRKVVIASSSYHTSPSSTDSTYTTGTGGPSCAEVNVVFLNGSAGGEHASKVSDSAGSCEKVSSVAGDKGFMQRLTGLIQTQTAAMVAAQTKAMSAQCLPPLKRS